MTAVKLALLELRRFRGPLRKLVPPLLCLIPLLYGAMYLWANWDPYGKLDRIPVAVVNQDHVAHTAQGQRVDAGREVQQQLKAAGTFQWSFTGEDEARDGLEQGRYYFTITIPSDFSAKLATASNTVPEQAGIDIRLNDANNYIAGIMTEVVQPRLQDQINAAAHGAYVRSIYGELSDVRDRLSAASNGAHRLLGATEVAQQGTGSLVSGSGALHDGAGQVSDGAAQVAEATGQIDQVTGELNRAVADRLPAVADAMVDTAAEVDRGTAAAHAATSAVKQGTERGMADLDELVRARPELADEPIVQRTREHARDLDARAGRADQDAARSQQEAGQALARAQEARDDVGQAQRKVLDANVPIRLIDSGAHSVAEGSRTITTGLGALEEGSGTMRTAADQANSAAADLTHTVDSAFGRIPATNSDQVTEAARVLGTPVRIDRENLNPAGPYGRGFAPFFFSIALWVFGLFAFLLLRPVNLRALAGRAGSFTIAVAGWMPAAILGGLGALILYAVVDLGLGLAPRHAIACVLLMLVGIAAFTAIDHFLRTALGVPGDVVSLVLLVLQLTSSGGLYPMPTTPVFFQALNPLLPMTYLVDGLRVTISGGLAEHLVRDFAVLGGFLVVFLLATTLVVRRQRMWTVSRLHPDVVL
ncbi:YhgE/Pip domain-containing protein [Saccharopolyspora gloriosae]|uniref:Putative membrane protein n=1 Tax=Saccharopolyspora gloriosae TaxID=455344 RepID=A0A840NJ31_9PSEU|nr:YhgE/Pip domain-containing protein [Saccharopolyspora gloriosae]MBB5070045.1 putative membrane protein [Saccharopolyspora gloriosae]